MIRQPEIPVVDLGTDGFDRLIGDYRERIDLIMRTARRHYGTPVLWLGDRLSRHWAARADLPYLDEYARVAAALGRPGAWLLNFSYEWGCTTAAVAEPSGAPRLLRAMDWGMASLGRTLLAVLRKGEAGGWINLGWPGFVGTVQGLAPGRFAAALNQAPDPESGYGRIGDWLAGKRAIWGNGSMPPALLLRSVFDSCHDFAEARRRLIDTPICASAFFTLVGTKPGDSVLVERTSRAAVVHDGLGAVSNHWLSPSLPGRSRSRDTIERLAAMRRHQAERTPGAPAFAWLKPPILNDTTRLALEAVPATGELAVRGYEAEGPATGILELAPWCWHHGSGRPRGEKDPGAPT